VISGNGHHDRPRDVAFERAFTITAASGTGVNPTALIQLAEQRAPLEPIRDFLIRDHGLDGLEEGADWRNYVCWLRMLIRQFGMLDDPRSRAACTAAQRCLAAILVAFQQQQIARALVADLLAEVVPWP
jgi:hypothetical protein